jgi:hypothetical protein
MPTTDIVQDVIDRVTLERNELRKQLAASLVKMHEAGERLMQLAHRQDDINPNGRIEQISRDLLMYAADAREQQEK